MKQQKSKKPIDPGRAAAHSRTTASRAVAPNIVQRKSLLDEEEAVLQGKMQPVQRKKNNTGLPDNLKSGAENLSGIALDDVKVHYNSSKPSQLQAHAYAQGTDIHLAPGQERHLPHEAWHVVQQKQGRVQPTMQMNGAQINDDKRLETEADIMGAKSASVAGGAEHQNLKPLQMVYKHIVQAVTQAVATSNKEIGELIGQNPPTVVNWATHTEWSEWYFSNLEYQDNKTGGWHSNRRGMLPGAPTEDGTPTQYVEFRRPGATGTKEVDKMERCIFDLFSGRCWPNAHYDGGYVEIAGIPNKIKKGLLDKAELSTGITDAISRMTEAGENLAGKSLGQIRRLALAKLQSEIKKE